MRLLFTQMLTGMRSCQKPFNVINSRAVIPYNYRQLPVEALFASNQHKVRGEYTNDELRIKTLYIL